MKNLLKIVHRGFSEKMCYYKILRVSFQASQKEIRANFLKLTKKYHPDVNNSEKAKNKFFQIKEAYENLSNKKKRREYNLKNGFMYEDSFDYDENSTEFNDDKNFLFYQDFFLKNNFPDFPEKNIEKIYLKINEENANFYKLSFKDKIIFFFNHKSLHLSFNSFLIYLGMIGFFVFSSFCGCLIEPFFMNSKEKIDLKSTELFLKDDSKKYQGLINKLTPLTNI